MIAVLAVAGILIFGGGSDDPAPKPNTVAQPAANSTTGANGATTPSKAPAKLNRKAVPLAVLNGTTVTGLARGAADKLTAKGYNEPNVVTNDTTNQQRPTTQVYLRGQGPCGRSRRGEDPRRALHPDQADGRQRARAGRPRRRSPSSSGATRRSSHRTART